MSKNNKIKLYKGKSVTLEKHCGDGEKCRKREENSTIVFCCCWDHAHKCFNFFFLRNYIVSHSHTLSQRKICFISSERRGNFFLYDDALSNENFLLFLLTYNFFFHHALKINFRCFVTLDNIGNFAASLVHTRKLNVYLW